MSDYYESNQTYDLQPPPLRMGCYFPDLEKARKLAQRLGYWEAVDADGYTFIVGHTVVTRPDGGKTVRTQNERGLVATIELTADGKPVEAATPAKEHASPPWTINGKPVTETAEIVLLKRWVAAGGKSSLLLAGLPGNGKTQCAAWCCGALGREFVWTVWPDVVKEMRSEYGKTERMFDDRLRGLFSASLLVVDDLIMPTAGDDRDLLQRLIDARWREQKPTIITSNLSLPDMEKTGLDARTASRMSSFDKIIFRGADYRRKPRGAKENHENDR